MKTEVEVSGCKVERTKHCCVYGIVCYGQSVHPNPNSTA